MAKYLLVYHGGGGMPSDEAQVQEEMNRWMAWFGSMGDAVVDGGNPTARAWTVSADGTVEGGGADPTTGYSILQADNMDAALVLAKGCPHLRSGGTIELCEILELG